MPGRRWTEGLHQAIEAKEGLRVQRESVTLATITFQNYFRIYDKLAGMTGTAMTEGEEFHKIYKLEVVAIPTNRPMVRARRRGPGLPERARQVQRRDRRDRGDDRGRPPGPRRHRVDREVGDPRRAPPAARDQARGPQRQVPRAGGGDRRPGRAHGGRDDRHQHGRPRHRHRSRRQPGGPHVDDAPPAGPQPGRGGQGDLRRGLPRGEGPLRRRARPGRGRGRPPHRRHRAPREPPDRQPAPRPRRPPGRPRLVALLPLARGRPDAALRLGSRGRPHGAARPRGRRGDRVAPREQDDRERPEPGRGLQLRHPQARRRVRRRHQQAARDDLRGARQGPPQRGSDRHGARLPRRGPRGAARPALRQRAPGRLGHGGPLDGPARHGPRRRGHERGRALGGRRPRGAGRSTCASWPRPGWRRRRPTSARPTGRWSSDWSCCGRSTRCGSSTSRSSTTCGAASASAATPSRIRSTSSRRRRSASTTSCRG